MELTNHREQDHRAFRSAEAGSPYFPFPLGHASLRKLCFFRVEAGVPGLLAWPGYFSALPQSGGRRTRDGMRQCWPGSCQGRQGNPGLVALQRRARKDAGQQKQAVPHMQARGGHTAFLACTADPLWKVTAVVTHKPDKGRCTCWSQDTSERVQILALLCIGCVTLDELPKVPETLTPHL